MTTIPVTGVGKIFKPELRIDALRRFVVETVEAAVGERGVGVAVSAGGKRGMSVEVTVSALDHALTQTLAHLLEGHNFDFTILVGTTSQRPESQSEFAE